MITLLVKVQPQIDAMLMVLMAGACCCCINHGGCQSKAYARRQCRVTADNPPRSARDDYVASCVNQEPLFDTSSETNALQNARLRRFVAKEQL